MRIDPVDHSTHRRPAKNWGPAVDAPTYLPADEVVLPLRKAKSDSVVTSAPRSHAAPAPAPAARAQSQSAIAPARAQSAPRIESQSVIVAPQLAPQVTSERSRRPSQSTVKPLPAAPAAGAAPAAALPIAPVGARTTEAPRGSQPVLTDLPPMVQFEGGATFDPLLIPLPPELAPAVYSWLRRLALQADLPGADRLLRDALADLTQSLSATIIYNGPDGLHSLGVNDELPKDTQPVLACAKARRAIVSTHVAYVPIVTTTETIAVIQLQRNSRQPAFNLIDNVTMAALARECASVMHHLVVQHLQRRGELEQDKKGLYRPEALESHRKRGQEGVVTELTPGWVRKTYWVLIIAILTALAFTFFIHIPTYSSGQGVIVFEGTPVTANSPGTVEAILVQRGDAVVKGTPILRIKSEKEESDLRQATTELEAALQQYLYDRTDETIRKQVVTTQATTKRAQDALQQKTILAPVDGIVQDVRPAIGAPIEFGGPICLITQKDAGPVVRAFLPSSDLPRLKVGMTLAVTIPGYEKRPEQAKIYDVAVAGTGAQDVRRALGPELADALKIPTEGGSFVEVKAKLPKRTFRAKGKTYFFHHGLSAKVDVKVENKRFLVTLLPSLEKYLP